MIATKELLNTEDALDFLDQRLDLTNLRMKLADPEEGKGYSKDRLDLMEAEYRKFLAMHLAFPEMEVVPCGIVDEMWHNHILDTIAYRADCDALFGKFLDHFPYFGLRGPNDAVALSDAYEKTLETYIQCFGAPPDGTWIAEDIRTCRTKCKPMKCK